MRAWSHDAGSRFPVGSAHLAPSFIAPPLPFPAPSFLAPPFPHPAPITVPPPWASTQTSVPATHRWAPHVLASTPTPVPLNPAPGGLPYPATPATPTAPTTLVAPALYAAPAPDAISMARVIPTNAQRSPFSALEGTMRPFKGPWVETARTVIEARLDPRWDPSVFRRETRKRRGDGEEQPPLKRARVEGLEEEIAEASVVGDTSADEGGSGKVMEMEIGGGAPRSERSEEIWPLESGLRRIAPKPAPGPDMAVGGLRPMPVVVPQVYGNAPNEHRNTSTTSTHGVDNPAGEFVIEAVPLSSGGPSTSTPADDQEEVDNPQEEDHDEGQHQIREETSLSASKREAAVVIDEKIYGRDPLRCLACNNMSFARKYERRRHIVTIHYLNKVPCDWCGIFFYARRDGVTRHKDENCPARDFEDRHTNPMRWFMEWLSGPSGWR